MFGVKCSSRAVRRLWRILLIVCCVLCAVRCGLVVVCCVCVLIAVLVYC